MRDALRYANYQLVGDAIGVTRSAVSKWAQGKQVSPYRLAQVEALFIPTPTGLEAIQAAVERIENELISLRAALEARTAPSVPSGDDPAGDPAPVRTSGRRGR